jgi:YD repeat-containing protein
MQTQAIGYTADGRIASFNPGIQTPGGQLVTSLSYNQDTRLAAVNATGGALASYVYDGFGQRLVKTISSSIGNLYQYGQNGLLLEETDASGAGQADYIYLDGWLIATLNNSTGAFYFLHDDMLGTPQLGKRPKFPSGRRSILRMSMAVWSMQRMRMQRGA